MFAITSSNQSELRMIDEKILKNENLMENYLNKAIDSMIEATVEEMNSMKS